MAKPAEKPTDEQLAQAILEKGLRPALAELKIAPQDFFGKMQQSAFLRLILFDEYRKTAEQLEQARDGTAEILRGLLEISTSKDVNPATRLQAGQCYLSFVGNLEKRKEEIEGAFEKVANCKEFFGI